MFVMECYPVMIGKLLVMACWILDMKRKHIFHFRIPADFLGKALYYLNKICFTIDVLI